MEAVLTTGRPSSPAGELRTMNGARHVAGGRTTVQLSVPYRLRAYDG